MTTPPLFGLVLAGGASTRMRTDKALLDYHGQPQLRWAFELAAKFCAATFVSVRPDQREDSSRAGLPQIVDRQPGIGPIAGISAALLEHPKAAWLVLACDLPFLTEGTLQHLIAHRDPHQVATAYRSAHDGLPEPLCAIWEPNARAGVLGYIASGKQCPRKFLINSDAALLDLPEPAALDNVNTREEFASASAQLGRKERTSKTVRVQYYAILREQAGRNDETLDTSAATPAELYAELRKRHPFQLAPEQLKVALNSEFGDWQTPLQHGDTVVFIPPVAGG
ncbi:MAG TPA: NTP transferase domain-containing protein [Steroidobacteraceae bacterium]|jgi:MoaD family protein, archaeal|nr:NTP transferase domain-containing protein [Steroidobacteraceae bacterium]